MITKPDIMEVPSYYHKYLDLVQSNDLIFELKSSWDITKNLILSIDKDKEDFAYSENKWTVKEVIKHIIECERIFAYRALRFSRLDNTELSGFYENDYINNTKEINPTMAEILEEYENVRKSTINLFMPMTNNMLDFKGVANKVNITTRAIGYITVGHNLHHCEIIKSRYL